MTEATPANEETPFPEAPALNEGIMPRTKEAKALVLGKELIRNGWTQADIDRLLGDPFIPGDDPSIHDYARVLLAELAGEVQVTQGDGFSVRQKFQLDHGGIPEHPHHPYAVFVAAYILGNSGKWLTVANRENVSPGEALLCVTRKGAHLTKVAEVFGSWKGFAIVQLEHEREAKLTGEEYLALPASLTGRRP